MMDIRQQIPRSWKQYTIMHLNRRVASIHNNGACIIYASSSGSVGNVPETVQYTAKRKLVKIWRSM